MTEEIFEDIKFERLDEKKSEVVGKRSRVILSMVMGLASTFDDYDEERGVEVVLNYLASAISSAISDVVVDHGQDDVARGVGLAIAGSVKKTREARHAAKSTS